MRAPTTYSEWIDVIAKFKNREDDETTLALMQRGTIDWQSGVAERFAKRLIDAVNYRMNEATDRFQREMTRAYGQERAIVQALIALRRELSFLAKAINIPAIPEKDRAQYVQLVYSQADSIQKSLEDSSRSDRTGKLTSIIRNNRVNLI